MKSSLFRVALILTALIVAAVSLPVCAEGLDTYIPPTGAEYNPVNPVDWNTPWWEICPPAPPRRKCSSSSSARKAETLIESIDAEGYCYTAIKKVIVRSQPSIYATKVATIRSARTEFTVSARVKNSSGEIWYAVLLANGTLGYIRSDLLNTDHVILLGDPYAYEEEQALKTVPASESASDVLNIARDEQPAVTPQVIYVAPAATQPTPTPILVYVTPAPEPTPQIIYVTPEE